MLSGLFGGGEGGVVSQQPPMMGIADFKMPLIINDPMIMGMFWGLGGGVVKVPLTTNACVIVWGVVEYHWMWPF